MPLRQAGLIVGLSGSGVELKAAVGVVRDRG
jgi:hypothetical protein